MDCRPLFPLPDTQALAPTDATRVDHARVVRPDRTQLQWMPRDLEASLPLDHPARAIWDLLEELALDDFYASIRAVIDRPGRPATDPRVLLALWLLATTEGIGSARQIARLCDEHDAYRWICGGVPVNYHMLADFRVAQQAALDGLLTQVIAALVASGTVTLERVAQDGMRVRASAGAASFRRKKTLKACLRVARAEVKRLAQERTNTEVDMSGRERAARERAARERTKRVGQALACLPAMRASKDEQRRHAVLEKRTRITEPRASVTDPEARIMKMPDGGFRPAYNVQLATDGDSGIIVGVAVTNAGSDAGQAGPVIDQIERRTGMRPKAYLMDGGFAAHDDITAIEAGGSTVYAPVRLPRNKPEHERYLRRAGDTDAVAAWRARMQSDTAKTVYRQRGAIAEWANAQVRQRGLWRFNVRGIANVTSVTLLAALAHNMMRWVSTAR